MIIFYVWYIVDNYKLNRQSIADYVINVVMRILISVITNINKYIILSHTCVANIGGRESKEQLLGIAKSCIHIEAPASSTPQHSVGGNLFPQRMDISHVILYIHIIHSVWS